LSKQRMFAIDLGASGGKCFAGTFEDGGFSMQEVHRFSHEGTSFFIPDRNGAVVERAHWDDVLLYRNIVNALQIHAREVSDHIDSIGIDSWGADGHFMNEDGEMLGKIYCYRDHHLDDMIEQVKARLDPRRIYEITGIHFQPFNVSNQLYWFVKNRRDLLRPGCFYLPVPTVFYYYLGGVRKVDSSWASVTQLMDARERKWSDEILAALDIPASVLPEIVDPGAVLGRLHEQVASLAGVNRARLIAAAAHDTASAFAAAPVETPEDALIISSGTWSLVGKLVPRPVTTDAAMEFNISNEGGIGNTRLLMNCMGTWPIQELRRAWAVADGREMPHGELSELARNAPPFEALIDPDDGGFYNPPDMEAAIAGYCERSGQPVPGTRGAFARAVFESLALKYRLVNERICGVCGSTSKVVNIVGGGCKNEMLNQFTADALGLPVLAGPEEATAVGNFIVQARGLGLIESIREAQPVIRRSFPIRSYRPAQTEVWDRAYERFRTIAG